MRIVLLGAPGAGKGTIAQQLGSRYRVPWISTGELFRSHLANQTELGRQASASMAAGGLVPDDVTCAMIAERLDRPDVRMGFILDGFPRTCVQADALNALLAASSPSRCLDQAIVVKCPDCLIIDRLRSRRVCSSCGRSFNMVTRPPREPGICDACSSPLIRRADDQPEIIAARLATYREQTAPLLDYYHNRGLLVEIDNT